jgi:signal peptidase I
MVEKLSYDFHDPRRGDVVVFDRPATWQVQDKVLIKRVIGVSGDRITIKSGRVFINGALIDEPYVNQKCKPQTTGDPGSTDTRARTFRTVPNGDLFVMGDNRCDSEDSRVFGVVPTGNVIGRAFLIVWPLGRLHSL